MDVEKQKLDQKIVVDQIVDHAATSEDWQQCCAELMKVHDVKPEQITTELKQRKYISSLRTASVRLHCITVLTLLTLPYLVLPAVMLPFLHGPFGLHASAGLLIWSIIGLCLLLRANKQWQFGPVLFFFTLPTVLVQICLCVGRLILSGDALR